MSISIPQGVTVSADGGKVSVKGPKGSLEQSFSDVVFKADAGAVSVESQNYVMLKTCEAHLKNMFRGVTEGFTVKLKVIYAHFPITLEVKGKEILIKNFAGEKQPRRSNIIGDVKVQVAGQAVTVSGASKYDVGQTVANLMQTTRTKKKDSRVFQDGAYIDDE